MCIYILLFFRPILFQCDKYQKLLWQKAVIKAMDMQRKCKTEAVRGRGDGACAMTAVGLPLPYEGVGNALRKSFSTGRRDLPDDMLALLAKLDRH